MDVFLRVLAIAIVVIILTALLYCLLDAVWLTIFDLGLGSKYKKLKAMALVVVGGLAMVFLIAHLTSFYPML